MDQQVLFNAISEQRNAALNQVAIKDAQLATANKTISELQAQCDALNAKLQDVSRVTAKSAGLDAPKKRPGRKPKALNGATPPAEPTQAQPTE